MRFSAILTLLGGIWLTSQSLPSLARTAPPDTTRADGVILDMAQAYRQRDRRQLSSLLPQARNHLLEPWAAYWELSARLGEAPASEIQDFFSRYHGTYQEDRLRAEWLLLLGRNRDWGMFNREYARYRMGDDRSIRCYALLAEHLATGQDTTAQVKDHWLGLREADEGCAAAAEQLLKDHTSSRLMVWQRARLGMENDRLKVVNQAVEMMSPSSLKTLHQIYLHPTKFLGDKLTALQTKTRELVVLALIRQAYLDPAGAAKELDKLRWKTQLNQEERSWVWGVIGKRAAQKLLPEAADYFQRAQSGYLHEEHLAWQVRSALRSGRWAQVLSAIDAMGETQRNDPAWVYWRARALLQSAATESQRNQALQLLRGIASERGFYEQLALEELGQRVSAPPQPPAPTPAEQEAAATHPGLQRALAAIRLGLRGEGVREWNYTTNLHTKGGMDDRSLLAAAAFACQNEVWDRCINTSERTKSFADQGQRYPMPFKADVLARTAQIGLDPAYVYGLIRQESRFIMDARSSVGASGLMQVMPPTAKWTAKKIGLVGFQPQQINDRDTNIAIGTGYLKLVLDSFEGSLPLAAAAYNAGPGRSRLWRGQSGAAVLEAAIWAENIPFNETRDYVKKVLANTTNYAALITGQPQSLKARLGQVGPRSAPLSSADEELP